MAEWVPKYSVTGSERVNVDRYRLPRLALLKEAVVGGHLDVAQCQAG